jgi:hypothetical protein
VISREFSEYRGLWWLPEDLTRRISGTLVIGERLKLTLDDELVKTPRLVSGEVQQYPKNSWDTHPVIHGEKRDGTAITMFDTWGGSIGLPFELMGTEVWDAQSIALGALLSQSDLFSEVSVSIDFLWDWTGSEQHKANWDKDHNFTLVGGTTQLCNVRVDGKTYELRAGVKTHHFGRSGLEIQDDAVWIVKLETGCNLKDAINDVVIPLQGFATFCTLKANRVTQLECTPEGSTGAIKIITTLRAHDAPSRSESQHVAFLQLLPGNIFLTSPHKILGRWLIAWNELREPLSRLLSIEYATAMYLEHRLSTVVQAGESLHKGRWDWRKLSKAEYKRRRREVLRSGPESLRSWLSQMLSGRNDPSLRERMNDVVHRALDSGFPYLLSDFDAFVNDLLVARNSTSHGGKLDISYDRQHWLGEGLTWLLRALCLQELGLKSDQIRLCLANNPDLTRCASMLGWSRAPSTSIAKL